MVTANKQLLCQHGEELWAAARERGVAAALRGRRRRRRPGDPRALRVARRRARRPHPRDRQRHDELHPHRDGRARAPPTTTRSPRRRSSATPRPTRPRTSPARTPRRRWRSSRGWRSARRSTSTRSSTRGSSTSPPTTWPTRDEFGLELKLIGHRRARRRGHLGARAPGVPLRRAPAGELGRAVQRGHGRVTGDHRDHDLGARAPAARRPRAPCSGDVVSVDDPAAPRSPSRRARPTIVRDVESAFYLHLEVADRPGVLAQVAELLGLQGVSVKSVVQRGLGENARLVMVTHPVLESRFFAAVDLIARWTSCAPRRGRSASSTRSSPPERMPGLIERYRDRLPFGPDDPVVTPAGGLDPARRAPRRSPSASAPRCG